jgi:FO synthase
VRALLCPDKLSAQQWLEVVAAAHSVGLRTTSTIMFGHVDSPRDWASHLLQLRDLQVRGHNEDVCHFYGSFVCYTNCVGR